MRKRSFWNWKTIQMTTRPRMHRQRAELALAHAPGEARPAARGRPRRRPGAAGRARRCSCRHRSPPSSSPPSPAGVRAAGDRADDLLARSVSLRVERRRASRPRRSTTMRSATSKTSTRLWLITTTPRPRSRRRWIRSSTCAVWATPSAAVGSSSITSFGSPSSERAIATDWRWPPESDATCGAHARDASTASESSSSTRALLHAGLVEQRAAAPGPAGSSRGRGRGWRRRRGCRHSARSW